MQKNPISSEKIRNCLEIRYMRGTKCIQQSICVIILIFVEETDKFNII